MGTFRVDLEIANPAARPLGSAKLTNVLVDTGAELSWIPAAILEALGIERNAVWKFRQADGTVLERWSGIAIVRVEGRQTGDEVVFAEPGDMTLLGARSLEGLNFRIEPVAKRLVDAGPAPAACAVAA
jgi:predicted aspartyl protease